MARLIGPDEASREVKAIVGGVFRSKAGRPAQLWADAAATVPADVLTEAGAAIPASTVTIDSSSMLPLVQFPPGDVDVIYGTCDGGPAWPVYARTDDRLDVLGGRVGAVEGVADGLGEAATLDVGTAAGTVAAGDDSRLVGAVQLAGDLGGVAAAPRTLWSPPRGRAWPASSPQMLAVAADSTMQAGHAWTVTNSTGSTAWTGEAASGGLGAQCVKVTTLGGGVGTQALMTLPRQTAFDMTGKAFRVLVKLDAATYPKLGFLKLYVGGGAFQFEWFWAATIATGSADPTLSIKAGEWVWLNLIPQMGWTQTGTPVMSQIRDLRFIIADDGTGPTTVYIGGVQIVPAGAADYPNGVISITFDDAYATQWNARQHMDRYRMPGTAYVIADRIGTDNAQWLSHPQLRAMQELSGWEIACHTYSSAAHASPWGYQTLGAAAATTDLLAVRRWLQDNGYRASYGLALAKGGWDLTFFDEMRRQLAYVRLVTGDAYAETLPPADPHRLRAYLPAVNATLSPNTTRNTLQWVIDQVAASKCWLILGFHNLPVTTSVGSDFPWATFTGLVDYIAASGIPVRTVSDVLGIGR